VKLNEAKRRCGKRGWRRFGGTRGADGEIDDVYSRSGGDGGGGQFNQSTPLDASETC
jgi:hypothetical protein